MLTVRKKIIDVILWTDFVLSTYCVAHTEYKWDNIKPLFMVIKFFVIHS